MAKKDLLKQQFATQEDTIGKQPKKVTTPKPTPGQWGKIGHTAPEEEILPEYKQTPTAGGYNPVSTPTAPKPSGGIIPTPSPTTSPVPNTSPLLQNRTQTTQTESQSSSPLIENRTQSTPAEPVDTGPSIQDIINQMMEARRQSQYAALDKAREAALANLTEQQTGIAPRYYDARNQVAAQSDVGALNFAQYMAGRGIKGAAGGMPEIYRNAALQGNIGALNQQEQAAYDRIARDRTGVQNAYEQDRLAAAADIDAQGLQAYINQMNADRAFGLQEGGLLGTYKGTPTLEAQNMQFNQGVTEAGLTGQYQGQPTFDYQKWQSDVEYRDKSFDENVRQFEANYGLDLKRLNLQQASQAIDAAYKKGQLSLQQAQHALNQAKFVEQQKQSEWERSQTELKNQQPADISGYMEKAVGMMNATDSGSVLAYIGSLPISAQQKADMANALGL